MAGSYLRAEELCERRETGAARSAGEEAAREADGVDDGTREAGAGQPLGLAVQERKVEAGVVRDQDGVLRELEEPPYGDGRMWLAAKLGVAEAGERRDHVTDRNPWIDE